MKLRLLQTAAAVTLAAGAIFAPVAANAYAPDAEDGSVVVTAGGTVTVTFTDFAPNEDVQFFLSGENASGASLAFVKFAFESNVLIGTKTATGSGSVSPAVTLPSNASGTYTLAAVGTDSGETADATITVAAAAGDPTLPATGGDSGQLLGLWIGGGALLLAGGGIAVATTVRRQRGQVSA